MLSLQPNDRFAAFIDGSNFYAALKALDFDIDYGKLIDIFKGQGRFIRAYYYTAVPDEADYSHIHKLTRWMDYNGFTVVTKKTREYVDADTGYKRIKGNMDMELALDVLKLAPSLDHVVLFSGDGDFVRLVQEVQNQGIRVTAISSQKTKPSMMADLLRKQVDDFIEIDDLRDILSRPSRNNDDAADDDNS